MSNKIDYDIFIKKMTNNKNHNIKLVKKYYDVENLDIQLQELTKYDVNRKLGYKKVLAIEAFLECGASPNFRSNFSFSNVTYEDNILFLYIQNYETQEKNLLKLIEVCLEHNVNINLQMPTGNTIMHYILDNMYYKESVYSIYNLLVRKGYDIFLVSRSNNFSLDEWYERYRYRGDIDKLFIKQYREDRERFYKLKYSEIIDKIEAKYPNLKELDVPILNKIVKEKYDEQLTLDVIKTLLNKGVNPNIVDEEGNNFIMCALKTGHHSINYAIKLIEYCLCLIADQNLDYNTQDFEGNTILHSLIQGHYTSAIIPLFEKMVNRGFDYTILNNNKQNILSLILNDNNIKDRKEFIDKYSHLFGDDSYKTIEELKDLGEIIYHYDLNYSNYLKNTLYIYDYKCCIIVGKTGSLKSKTLKHLARCHADTNKPQNVFLTSADIILKNCKSIGNVREVLVYLFEKCRENKLPLFIDDLDKLYTINNNEYYKKQLNIILNYYVTTNKNPLSLVFTINSKNVDILRDEVFQEILGYNFEIDDYKEDEIKYYIDDFISGFNKDVDEELLNILKEVLVIVSKRKNINDNYDINNIKVVTETLNNLFNNDNKDIIEIKDIIYSIKINKYIKDEIKDIVIKELKDLNNNYSEENIKKLVKTFS